MFYNLVLNIKDVGVNAFMHQLEQENQHNSKSATREKHNIMDVRTIELERPREGNELSRHSQTLLLEMFLENRKLDRN
jgi:hypothetical protein